MSKQRWLITYRLQVWGGHTCDYSEEIHEHPVVWLNRKPKGTVLLFALEIAEDVTVSMPHSSGAKEAEEEGPGWFE